MSDESGILESISNNSTMINGAIVPDNAPVETEVVEEVVEAAPEVKKEEDLFSKRFAALSKKEKALRQRESSVNARMAELEARLKGMEPKVEAPKPIIPIERRLRENPLDTLKELGLSYEKLTELALNDGKVSMEDRIELMKEEMENRHKSEIESIRNELLEKDKQNEEQKYKEIVQNFMVDLTGFVNDIPDYELIRANDAVDLVYEVIEQHHAKSGKILSNKEAADHVESHLLQEAQKFLKLKKLGYKEPQVAEKKPVSQNAAPTLSNSNATTLSNKVGVEIKSDYELKKLAASMLKWE